MTRSTLFIILVILGSNGSLGEELSVASNETTSPSNHNGFGYELIQSKLDYLEYRFSELFVQLKEQTESFLINQQRVDAGQQQLNRIVERHGQKIIQLVEGIEDSFGYNVSLISDQLRRILELQTICSNHDVIRNSLFDLRPKNLTWKPIVSPTEPCTETSTENSTERITGSTPICSKLPRRTSGLCMMDIGGISTVVNLEQHRFGNDWLIVLHRFDGSENFNRSWSDYRNGFGTAGQEYWLGLEKLRILTESGSYEMLIEMETFNGISRYARYSKFTLGTESELYPLKELGTHSGTAKDSLTRHVGSKFSTFDNGPHISNALSYSGGWWYYGDYESHLTGVWKNTGSWISIVWIREFSSSSLKFARMMIRKI